MKTKTTKPKLNPLLMSLFTKAAVRYTEKYVLKACTSLNEQVDHEFHEIKDAKHAFDNYKGTATYLALYALDQFGSVINLIEYRFHTPDTDAPIDLHPGHEHDPQDEILKTLESIKPMTWEEYQALHVDWMVSESELSRAYSEYLSEQVKA